MYLRRLTQSFPLTLFFHAVVVLFLSTTTRTRTTTLAFQPLPKVGSKAAMSSTATTSTTTKPLPHHDMTIMTKMKMMMDGTLLADGAVAVASFAAGVLTTVPRMQALEQNITATRAEAAAQIEALEARLYALDEEYEQGTADLQRQFEALRVDQLRKQKRRQAEEYQYKLQAQIQTLQDDYERQLQQQKSMLLSQQLQDLNDVTGGVDQRAELLQLRLQQTQLQERNEKLAALLAEAQTQIEDFQRKEKNKFLSFFGMMTGKEDDGNNNNNKTQGMGGNNNKN